MTRFVDAGDMKSARRRQVPITSDSEMHAPEIAAELADVKHFEDGYLSAIADRVVR